MEHVFAQVKNIYLDPNSVDKLNGKKRSFRNNITGKTHPTDDINKVWQEGSNLGVGLEVQQSHLKHTEDTCNKEHDV